MIKFLKFMLCFMCCLLQASFGKNPLITSKFTADPCAMVYGNTVYLYTGHDEATTTDTDYRMNNWHVFSSQDMVNWTDHGQRMSLSNFSWANAAAFAGHTIHRNGKFYWYVPMLQKGGGFFSIGVAVADSPLGPFTDALGKPLIADNATPDLKFDIDPAVFIDDNGQAYIYWGNATEGGPCKMAKLKPNMTELDGSISTVTLPYFTEAPYVHKKNGTYYMTYAAGWPETIDYATSTSPMGPWTHKGVLNSKVTSATNHQSIIDFKGKSYFVYHNAFPALGGGDYRRSVCIDLLNYNTDGSLKPIARTTEGVPAAQYTTEITPWLAKETITGTHDPTIIRDNRGVYTMLSTNNLCEIRQSTNMVNWTSRGRIFNSLPSWMTSIYSAIENIWAPHICFRNGRYWVYYCGSSFGSNNSVIGVASSPTLDYQAANYAWTDHGEVFRSTTSNNYNAIDPELLIDKNGKLWLSFGSFWQGLRMIEIDANTGKRLGTNTTVYNIASRNGAAIEGPSTIEHNGYYYLFSSWDKCCAGTESTYRTMVGRSSNPNSGYVDKNGTSLTNNASSELLKQYGRYYGPGGGSPFRDGRRDYYVLHYYNASQNGNPTLQIREIVWTDDNWPVLAQPFLGRRLSYEAEHALLTSASITLGSGASNAEYVNNMTATGSKVQFYLNAFAAGDYTLRVHYAATDAYASHFLKVNNGTATEVIYPKTATLGQFPNGQSVSIKVTLKEGANIVEFAKGMGTAELDRIDLVRNTLARLEGGAMDNRVATPYIATNNNATLTANSWIMFENVDFANGGLKTLTIALQNAGIAQFRINLDTQTGAASATLTTGNSSKTNVLALPTSFQNITGLHDVYVTLLSGNIELDYLQFGLNDAIGTADCNGTIDGTATLDNCDRCIGGTTSKTACNSVAEAETEACAFNGVIEANNTGYKGTGYLNANNALDGSIDFYINGANAGAATLSFRYASATDRPAQILVNGVPISTLNFTATVDFTTWKTIEVNLTLIKGNNLVKLSPTTATGLANIDQIGYVSSGLSKGTCVVTDWLDEQHLSSTNVYPNPFTNSLMINTQDAFTYTVYSMLGNPVEQGNGTNLKSIGNQWTPGIYMLEIRQSGQTKQIKVIKN